MTWTLALQQLNVTPPKREEPLKPVSTPEGRLQKYALEILADGKERTTNHVSIRLKHPQRATQKVLYSLYDRGLLTKEVRSARSEKGGITNMAFWRLADAAS